jgi:hypothetical protein
MVMFNRDYMCTRDDAGASNGQFFKAKSNQTDMAIKRVRYVGISNTVFNRRMWNRKVPGACKYCHKCCEDT